METGASHDMPCMIRRTLLLLLLLPAAAQAEAVHATYSAYATGLNVLNLDADFTLTPTTYRVHTVYCMAGTVGALFSGQQDTTVEGRFVAGRPVPQRFYSQGHLRGRPRVTLIDYPAGNPVVRTLVPPNEDEREPVPEALQAHTIDTISAMAQLMRQVAATGRCEGSATTFDGRRLSEITVRTVGMELIEPSSRSRFQGPALRCDFEGRLLAGFRRDDDPERMRRPQQGSAWFAAVTPGAAPIPVRLTFQAPVLGTATLYLTGSGPGQPGG